MTPVLLPPLPERFTHDQAQVYLRSCQSVYENAAQAAAGSGVWQLPAGALESFDSSILAVCLSLSRMATAHGASLELLNCPQGLHDLSVLYGVDTLLTA
jgi:phospholipid transport system transporter-binding protein